MNPCTEPIVPSGDGRTWACDKCRKPIHDLSALTEEGATEWLREHAGQRECVRFTHDRRGNIVFAAAMAAAVSACSAADIDGVVAKLQRPATPPVIDAGLEFSTTYGDMLWVPEPAPAASVHAHCNASDPPKRK